MPLALSEVIYHQKPSAPLQVKLPRFRQFKNCFEVVHKLENDFPCFSWGNIG